jgi:hypothetical protein
MNAVPSGTFELPQSAVFPIFIDTGAIRVRTGMQPGNATEHSQQDPTHHQIAGNPRRSPFLCILGRVRLPMKRMEA